MEKIFSIIGIFFCGIIILIILAILLGFPIMWLWNWLMPIIFELPKIKFLQAVGLNLLSGLLIRSTNNYRNK